VIGQQNLKRVAKAIYAIQRCNYVMWGLESLAQNGAQAVEIS
jgi:hypothetical protein